MLVQADSSGGDVKTEGDEIVCECSGRRVYANCGYVGIDEGLTTCGGYDDGFVGRDEITLDERRELAEYMIGLWTRFREDT